MLSRLGASKGGKASAAALTPEERTARARAAVSERWKDRKELPIDQTAVMARLKATDPVVLRIAPGGGGDRRWAAIKALEEKHLLRIVDVGTDTVTVSAI